MKQLWRISKHNDLEGLGGEKTDGRWHTAARGKRIVYFSEHPALALIEVLANLKGNPKLFPDTYQLMKVTVTDTILKETVDSKMLSSEWHENVHQTQALGDSWFARAGSALLGVPSAPSPESWNYLFNPLHLDAANVAIEWCKRIAYDKRLFHIHEPIAIG